MYWFWIWDFVLSRLFEVLVSSVNREERTSVSAFLAAAYLHFFDIGNSNFALTPTRADTLYLVRFHNSIVFSLGFGEFFPSLFLHTCGCISFSWNIIIIWIIAILTRKWGCFKNCSSSTLLKMWKWNVEVAVLSHFLIVE